MPDKDPIWEHFLDLKTTKDFNNLSSNLELDNHIPNDIQDRFELVQKLVRYSYYEYDFLDAALSWAFTTFEFALRHKLAEYLNDNSSDKGFGNLIDQANNEGLFDYDKQRIHTLRKIRNDYFHTDRNQKYGILSLNAVLEIAELINGLYEKVDIRIERKKEIRKTNKKIKKLFSNGASFKSRFQFCYLEDLELIYFNNQKENPNYTFWFFPIFPIPDTSKTFQIGRSIVKVVESYTIEENELIMSDKSEEITISQIRNDEKKMIKIWKNKLEESFTMFEKAKEFRKFDILNVVK